MENNSKTSNVSVQRDDKKKPSLKVSTSNEAESVHGILHKRKSSDNGSDSIKNANSININTDPEISQNKGLNTSKNKSVVWDWKSLEEQEEERKRNPRKKIDEPKTPYLPYEGDEDEYLKQLNEINKTQPTKDVLDKVCMQLEKEKNKQADSEKRRFSMEVEVIDGEGHVTHEVEKEKDENKKKEFLKKRQNAYHNEFLLAKKRQNMGEEEYEEEDEDNTLAMDNQTLKNTLFNKFYGKVEKK